MSQNSINQTINESDFIVQRSTAGTPSGLLIRHSSNTPGSDSVETCQVDGAASGDAFLRAQVNGGRSWAIGMDTSDSQRLKIKTDAAAGVTPSTGTLLATFDPATVSQWLVGLSFDSGTNIMGAYVTFGTWTPVIAGATVAGAGTYTTQFGRYSQVGNIIFATCQVVWTAHTGTGNMLLTGLPQIVRSVVGYSPVATINSASVTFPAATAWIVGQLTQATTQMQLFGVRNALANLNVAMDATGTINMSCVYVTN